LTTVKEIGQAVFTSMLPQRFESPRIETCEAHQWFAVRVRSNQERTAIAHLRERGYQQFAPSYKSERRWSDRKKEIDQYLFPGYIFCRFDPEDRLAVLTAPGVVDLVGFGRTPEPIPDQEIERVRRMIESGLLVTPYPFLNVGQGVFIERGPLSGLEGILVEMKGKHRLVVSINLLQRSVSAEVDRQSVRAVRALVMPGARRLLLAGIPANSVK
jgi:transcriptional antiterminator NusG